MKLRKIVQEFRKKIAIFVTVVIKKKIKPREEKSFGWVGKYHFGFMGRKNSDKSNLFNNLIICNIFRNYFKVLISLNLFISWSCLN